MRPERELWASSLRLAIVRTVDNPQTAAAMGITASSLERQIRHIERVAVHDDGAEPLDVYLIELTSVTVAATHAPSRPLRQ